MYTIVVNAEQTIKQDINGIFFFLWITLQHKSTLFMHAAGTLEIEKKKNLKFISLFKGRPVIKGKNVNITKL